jgi:LacI family transcriptional regulator
MRRQPATVTAGPVTLADVARRAGVSPATASRVINGSSKPVADDLRERVLRAVDDLRYVPNAHAQSLARAQRSAVGVIVHDVSDPYFAEITRGLQRVAIEHGRLLVICNSYRDPAREREYVELLHANQVAAIVLAGSGIGDPGANKDLANALAAYSRTGGRVAVIGRHTLPGDAVLPANEDGAYMLGVHVFGLGHRKVGIIGGPQQLTSTTDRLAGLRTAAREHGTTIPGRRVAYADFTRDGGAAAVEQLLASEPGLTAVIAFNDAMAIGALAYLRERGCPVPDQISVAGFDDMPIAQDLTPPLTTVRLPLEEMGARAIAMALDPQNRSGPRVERVDAELIVRASTAPPPSS